MTGTDGVMVVTGASRGLGLSLARQGLAAGMRVGACSRSGQDLEPDERVLSERVDVTDAAAVERFGQAVAARFGRIDLWINNAGLLAPIGRLADVDASAFRTLVDANVMGVMHGSATFARITRGQGKGTLVNISSGAARSPYHSWSAYCASKAAVDRMSECIALEEPQLRVYSLAPGIIETDMQALIRQQDEASFPDVEKFRALHADGALVPPDEAARQIIDYALNAKDDGVCVDLRG